MSTLAIQLKKNADNTLTVRVGRMVEHIGLGSKDKGQVYDQVKYALISKGINFDPMDLTEMLYKELVS